MPKIGGKRRDGARQNIEWMRRKKTRPGSASAQGALNKSKLQGDNAMDARID